MVPLRSLAIAAVTATASVLLIIGALLTWTGAAFAGADGERLEVSVNGVGSATVSWTNASVPTREESIGYELTPEAVEMMEKWDGAVNSAVAIGAEAHAAATGKWTLAAGLLVALGALFSVIRLRVPAFVVTAVAGLAAVITAAVVVGNPAALLNADDYVPALSLTETSAPDIGVGLWLTLAGSVVASVAGGLALWDLCRERREHGQVQVLPG